MIARPRTFEAVAEHVASVRGVSPIEAASRILFDEEGDQASISTSCTKPLVLHFRFGSKSAILLDKFAVGMARLA